MQRLTGTSRHAQLKNLKKTTTGKDGQIQSSFLAHRNPWGQVQSTDRFAMCCSCQGNPETRPLPPSLSTVHRKELERHRGDMERQGKHRRKVQSQQCEIPFPPRLLCFTPSAKLLFLSDWALGGWCPWCLPQWNCNVFQVSLRVSLDAMWPRLVETLCVYLYLCKCAERLHVNVFLSFVVSFVWKCACEHVFHLTYHFTPSVPDWVFYQLSTACVSGVVGMSRNCRVWRRSCREICKINRPVFRTAC